MCTKNSQHERLAYLRPSYSERDCQRAETIQGAEVDEMLVCQARALIRELWPDEFAGKPKLTVVKESAVVKKPTHQRPAIFELGPLEARRRAAIR
ncbi:hypothetical protein EAH88_11745 [Rhodanobacter glycinis]|uniref:Uncharacterized protein n=1 Tax=Rhodanobacter glycinis TaxID=582702 RepID=A0A502C6H0_9GAMM|nr:hypothetical protein EAH88_11745 [Rhodanobacter glycinis]